MPRARSDLLRLARSRLLSEACRSGLGARTARFFGADLSNLLNEAAILTPPDEPIDDSPLNDVWSAFTWADGGPLSDSAKSG